MKGKFFALSGLIYVALSLVAGFVFVSFPISNVNDTKLSDFFASHSRMELMSGSYLLIAGSFFIVLYGLQISGIMASTRNEWSYVILIGTVLIATSNLFYASVSEAETSAFYDSHLPISQVLNINAFQQASPMFANGAFAIYMLGSAGALWTMKRPLSYVAIVIGVSLFTPAAFSMIIVAILLIAIMSVMQFSKSGSMA